MKCILLLNLEALTTSSLLLSGMLLDLTTTEWCVWFKTHLPATKHLFTLKTFLEERVLNWANKDLPVIQYSLNYLTSHATFLDTLMTRLF